MATAPDGLFLDLSQYPAGKPLATLGLGNPEPLHIKPAPGGVTRQSCNERPIRVDQHGDGPATGSAHVTIIELCEVFAKALQLLRIRLIGQSERQFNHG